MRSLEGMIEDLYEDLEELEERQNPSPAPPVGVVEVPRGIFAWAGRASRDWQGKEDPEEYKRRLGQGATEHLTAEQREAFEGRRVGIMVLPRKAGR